MTKKTLLLVPSLLLFAIQAQAVEVSIHNELKRREDASTLYVEHALSYESPKTRYNAVVLPGREIAVLKGNVMSFTLIRKYDRFKLKYKVECDNVKDTQVVLNVDDFFREDLGEHCWIAKRGHISKSRGPSWTELERPTSSSKRARLKSQ